MVRYQRGGTVQDNDRTCVLKAAASSLFYLGYERIAFFLANDLGNGKKIDGGFEFFMRAMQ
jgi:hypothetical protein